MTKEMHDDAIDPNDIQIVIAVENNLLTAQNELLSNVQIVEEPIET